MGGADTGFPGFGARAEGAAGARSRSADALAGRALETRAACAAFVRRHGTGRPYVFVLTTALALCGVELPERVVRVWPRLGVGRLQVAAENRNQRRRRGGRRKVAAGKDVFVETFVWRAPLDEKEVVPGVSCASPIATWVMFARWLDVEELVVLGDCILRRRPVHAAVAAREFEDYLERVARVPGRARAPKGIGTCRLALGLMREGTDSSRETRTRLALMRHGLPCPVVNHGVTGPGGEHWILDTAWPEAKVAVEYDGGFHREQWAQDISRRNGLLAMGWVVVPVTKDALASPRQMRLVAQIVADRLREVAGVRCRVTNPVAVEALARRYRPRKTA